MGSWRHLLCTAARWADLGDVHQDLGLANRKTRVLTLLLQNACHSPAALQHRERDEVLGPSPTSSTAQAHSLIDPGRPAALESIGRQTLANCLENGEEHSSDFSSAPLPLFCGLCQNLEMFLVDGPGTARNELGRREVTVSQDKKGNLSSLS